MRILLTTLAACAALVALAVPPVGALPGPLPEPTAPGVCGADCVITALSTGYDPTVTLVPAGAQVSWLSEDITHVTRDLTVSAAALPCFDVFAGQGDSTPPVRFDLEGTQLVATVDGVSTPCANAIATPGGAVLPYFCSIHPTMRAALVITAA